MRTKLKENPQRRRVARVRIALTWPDYLPRGRTSKEHKNEALRDILADLRHYCDAHGLDFGAADRMAYQHYLAERGPARLTMGAPHAGPQS